jgi:hypothetical protein
MLIPLETSMHHTSSACCVIMVAGIPSFTGQRFQFEDFKKALEASVAPGRGPKSPKVFLESK